MTLGGVDAGGVAALQQSQQLFNRLVLHSAGIQHPWYFWDIFETEFVIVTCVNSYIVTICFGYSKGLLDGMAQSRLQSNLVHWIVIINQSLLEIDNPNIKN